MRLAPLPLLGLALAAGLAAQTPRSPDPKALPSLKTGGGNAWFDNTRLNLGTFTEAEMATGIFRFQNPRKVPHTLSAFRATCACARADIRVGDRRYEIRGKGKPQQIVRRGKRVERIQVPKIVVGPGESGRIEVQTKLGTFRGARDATLAFSTTDRRTRLIQLRWQATNLGTFAIQPEEVNLSRMTTRDQRPFSFVVRSNVREDFELRSPGPLPVGMKVDVQKEIDDGRAVWHVKGTYGPGARPVDNGGRIVFTTDIPRAVAVMRVVADVVPPVLAEPGNFVLLGMIPADKGKDVPVRFVVTDGSDVSITRVEVVALRGIPEDQRELVQIATEKDGAGARMVIRIGKGLKPTTINGEVTVHLDHPAMPTATIKFAGSVR